MKTGLKLLLLALLLAPAASCKYVGRAFGPKDKGGLYLIVAVKADDARLDRAVTRTIEVMQGRCESLNVYCKAERVGGVASNRIKLRISDPKDPERVKGVILSQGLELRAVVSPQSPLPVQTYPTQEEAAEAAGADKDVLPYREDIDERGGGGGGQKYIVAERAPVVTGEDIRDAEAVESPDAPGAYWVNFTLRPEGAVKFSEWTGAHVGSYLAVVLNRQVRSVAYIRSQISDSGQISGHFTREQAEDAALVLKSGNLPAPIEALEEGVYKP